MNDTAVEVHSNRNRLPVPGILYNTNTLESFQALDRQQLMSEATQQIWDDICSGRAEENTDLLNRFLVISYADLKKWTFTYWFAFPGLVMTPPATTASSQPASEVFNKDEAAGILAACTEWRALPSGESKPHISLQILGPSCYHESSVWNSSVC
jgi:ubiquitin-like modifier-activating enzyme ATG7